MGYATPGYHGDITQALLRTKQQTLTKNHNIHS